VGSVKKSEEEFIGWCRSVVEVVVPYPWVDQASLIWRDTSTGATKAFGQPLLVSCLLP